MVSKSASLKFRIYQSNYGRDTGWQVELAGHPVALLVDATRVDMFIDSYRVEPLAESVTSHQIDLSLSEFWKQADLQYRNREFNEIAAHAIALGPANDNSGRILMRGLYLDISNPKPWDAVSFWLQQKLANLGLKDKN